MSRILTDAEFDRCIQDLPLLQRGRLLAHNAVLQYSLRTKSGAEEERERIVQIILAECGDADTVRANHARKLALRIRAGEGLKSVAA